VATAAHTFDRAAGVKLRNVDGNEVTAEVVYADFDKDIALLTVDPPNNDVFDQGEPEDGATVRLISYDNAETGPEVKDGVIIRTVTVTLDGEGRRQAIELQADIERGDSGGPVLDGKGRAVGMVFASSRAGERGWAVTLDEVAAEIEQYGEGARRPLAIECDS
jgi:S1-C subfamily serine protease